LILYEPLGIIYILVPFNFPFWLNFKSMIGALSLGNSVVVRNSDSTPLTGLAIEELMQEAGFSNGEYQHLLITHEQSDKIIGDMRV